MIKSTISLVAFLFSFTAFSQQLKLKPDFPEVRQGETIGIDIHLEGKDSVTIIQGGLNLSELSKDTGIVNIGPASIKVNNVSYTSDSFPIRIIGKLPNQESGIWAKIVKTKEGEFLIIEERVDMDKSSSYSNRSYIYGTGNYAVNEQGLKISQCRYSSSREYILDENGVNHTVNYQIVSYKIEKDKTFKGGFKLEKRYFNTLSDEGIFPHIVVD